MQHPMLCMYRSEGRSYYGGIELKRDDPSLFRLYLVIIVTVSDQLHTKFHVYKHSKRYRFQLLLTSSPAISTLLQDPEVGESVLWSLEKIGTPEGNKGIEINRRSTFGLKILSYH